MRGLLFFVAAFLTCTTFADELIFDGRMPREQQASLEDADVIRNICIYELKKLIALPHKPRTIEDSDFQDDMYSNHLADVDFSYWKFRNVPFYEWYTMKNLNFTGADFDGGYYELWGDNINLTDAAFRNCGLHVRNEDFMQTRTYRERTTDSLSLSLTFRESCSKYLDLSGLHFRRLDSPSGALDCRADNLSFSGTGIAPTQRTCHQALTPERMCTTANYKLGFFRNSHWAGPEVPADMKKVCFVNSKFGLASYELEYYPNASRDVKHVDFEDAMFIECEVYPDVMTLDQIKQTWNYKTGRMDLITLPPELQKQVDAELAKEGRKPETE